MTLVVSCSLQKKFKKLIKPLISRLRLGNSASLAFTCTAWNSHGAFGSSALLLDSSHIKKFTGLRRILTSSHISCILESHADFLEVCNFARTWAHSHIFFVSNARDRNCGGVFISIRRSFVADSLISFGVEVVPGRILMVFLIFPSYALCIIAIQNSPTWSFAERRSHFGFLRSLIVDAGCLTTFIIGDLNFSDDCLRFHGESPDVSISAVHKSLSDTWFNHFGDFSEIIQDDPTFMRGN